MDDPAEDQAALELAERSARRRARIEGHRAASHADAEAWDLEYWQRQGPEARLAALVALQRDVALVEADRDESVR